MKRKDNIRLDPVNSDDRKLTPEDEEELARLIVACYKQWKSQNRSSSDQTTRKSDEKT